MRIFYIFALLFLFGQVAVAQDYVLSISSGTIPEGGSGSLTISMDNNGLDVQGWSYGACNDTAFITCTSVEDGATTATVNNGGPPGFNEVSVNDEGFTVGVVICFTGCAVLPGGTTGSELNVATYELIGAADTSTSVDLCATLGNPAVEILVVVAGQSILPTTTSGTVDLVSGPPPFSYLAGAYDVDYDGNTGETTLTVTPSILEDPSNPGFPNDTQGFSMGMEHDPALLTVESIAWNEDIGFSPDFEGINTTPSNGWTIGVVYSFTGVNTLAFETAIAVLNVEYSTDGSALAGLDDPTTTALSWSNELGSPPVVNVVVVGGQSLAHHGLDVLGGGSTLGLDLVGQIIHGLGHDQVDESRGVGHRLA